VPTFGMLSYGTGCEDVIDRSECEILTGGTPMSRDDGALRVTYGACPVYVCGCPCCRAFCVCVGVVADYAR
jgi:hypothetical protein